MLNDKRVAEWDEQCQSCGGTGLYVGMAERDGAAVVCHACKGTGRFRFRREYIVFTQRQDKPDVLRVFRTNPGIVIGVGKDHQYSLSDFGGMDAAAWNRGDPFPPKSEMRQFSCPAWWYQAADYEKKPDWSECGFGRFSDCQHFCHKHKCWERWDREFGPKVTA